MSFDHNQAQLLNTTYNETRQLRADFDDMKARLDALVTNMNEFRESAMTMLQQMAAAHAPKGESVDRQQ